MILMLRAEMESNGLWDYEKDEQVKFTNTPLSINLIDEIMQWTNDYLPYTALPNLDDKSILYTIERLDEQGIDILKKIKFEWSEPEKFYYYSVAKDELKYVLYKNESDKSF